MSSDAPTVSRKKLEVPGVGRSYTLIVVSGPDQGKRFTCDATQPQRMLIGKSEACEAPLTDPTVSRRHAAVELYGERLKLTDLGSTNGTTVNSVAIAEAYLAGGETIALGGSLIRVESARVLSLPPPTADRFERVLGQSAAMRRLYPLCARLAASTIPLIIEGETGTGKEQLAEALHQAGSRARAQYIVFDCTAVSPALIESELFGHEKGAFTGAIAARRGVFERAHGGTLLIDEIGDLPFELQSKLLRALERSEITRVGGDRALRVDVRVIAATRRDLDRAVQEGRFREDLFHRLAVGRIELPPLRARSEDIELLARHFCAELGGSADVLTPAVLARFSSYAWPGNVRELKNAVARLLVLGEEPAYSQPDAPEPPRGSSMPAEPAGRDDTIARVLTLDLPLAEARQKVVDEFERRYVERLLAEYDGNVSRAAAAAGVARRHLQRLKAKLLGGEEPEESEP